MVIDVLNISVYNSNSLITFIIGVLSDEYQYQPGHRGHHLPHPLQGGHRNCQVKLSVCRESAERNATNEAIEAFTDRIVPIVDNRVFRKVMMESYRYAIPKIPVLHFRTRRIIERS